MNPKSEQNATSLLPPLAPATLSWQPAVVSLEDITWLCSQDPPEVPELGLGPAIPPYSVVLDGGISTRDNGRGKAEITTSSPGLDLNLQSL